MYTVFSVLHSTSCITNPFCFLTAVPVQVALKRILSVITTRTSLLPDTPRALLPPSNTQTFFTALAPLCLPHWHHASPLRILLRVKYLSRYMGMLFSLLCVKDARGLRVCFALAEEFVVVDSWMKTDYSSRIVWHLVSLFELRKLEY